MRHKISLLAIIVMTLIDTVHVQAQDKSSSVIPITHGFAYPSLGMARPAIAFITINNQDDVAHELIKAEASANAEHIEIHRHTVVNGVMEMREVPRLTIPAKTRVELEASHLHLMLMHIKKPLKVGDSFPLTLHLDNNMQQTITITVRPRT